MQLELLQGLKAMLVWFPCRRVGGGGQKEFVAVVQVKVSCIKVGIEHRKNTGGQVLACFFLVCW